MRLEAAPVPPGPEVCWGRWNHLFPAQRPHAGSLKLALAEICTAQKLANAMNQVPFSLPRESQLVNTHRTRVDALAAPIPELAENDPNSVENTMCLPSETYTEQKPQPIRPSSCLSCSAVHRHPPQTPEPGGRRLFPSN